MDFTPNYPREDEFDVDVDSIYQCLIDNDFEKFKELIKETGVEDEETAWQLFVSSRRDISSIERTYHMTGMENDYDSIVPDDSTEDLSGLDIDDIIDQSLDIDLGDIESVDSSIGDYVDTGYGGDGGMVSESAPLNLMQRRKRGIMMKRLKSRMRNAKRIMKNRVASVDRLKQRAQNAARAAVKAKMAGQRKYSTLSPSEKMAVDKRFSKVNPSIINRIAQKLLPQVRKKEMQRMQNRVKGAASKKNESADPERGGYLDLRILPIALAESTALALQERGVVEVITMTQVKAFEKVVDSLFKKYDINFDFTKHFAERMSDERNDPLISLEELAALFKKIYNSVKSGNNSLSKFEGVEAVLKDLQSNLNIPVAIEYNRRTDDLDIATKTIMRKKDFRTPNAVIKY